LVKESRAEAIPEILVHRNNIECFILDDAFQHLSIESGLNILLTSFKNPFYKDLPIPAGRLREPKNGYKRADIIVVTKCDENLSDTDKQTVVKQIDPTSKQQVFFSYLAYSNSYFIGNRIQTIALDEDFSVLLLAGIAETSHLEKYVLSKADVIYRQYYSDHHSYTENDMKVISDSFNNIDSKKKLILTTEKDAEKLLELKSEIIKYQMPIFILPVEHQFFPSDKEKFDRMLFDYVNEYIGKY